MLRTIVWFTYFVGYLIYALPSLGKAKRLKKEGHTEAHHHHVKKITGEWARFLVKKAGGKIHVYGEENIPDNETVLIVCNHQGNFDIPILLGYFNRKISFISKIEVKKLPIIRTWMEHMNCIFMDRKNKRQAVKSIIAGVKLLEQGQDMVIFPEGTRSKGDPIARFKKGSFKLATKSKVTILPVAIDGSYLLMEANNNRICPADVHVRILEPVRIHQEKSDIDVGQLAEIVQQKIEASFNTNEQSDKKIEAKNM
ncbi:lysophospholipid acyltransferase family protein [Evansella tamaricis]|uniref:1-acyl-sn-glycerol-3-phosphate acyltransferase n=1 Tax=Evansella tamaricis TaxID=2069301 RepID=A0ABS6J9I5_9BACI|nr:lysophospholipid acyltransferase family protein [Evansella tamaricis]MBU9710337.1 1-acyl-sn-glycerol-3-phosphate acyltransferase [Evansella tamaricis]